jgi:hypothetical protein
MKNMTQYTNNINNEQLLSGTNSPLLICSNGGQQDINGGCPLVILRENKTVLERKFQIPEVLIVYRIKFAQVVEI